MKTLLVFLFLLTPLLSVSQNSQIFDNEWYEKLDSDLEYIIFPNPSNSDVNIRIYRTSSLEHSVLIQNTIGQTVFKGNIKREDKVPISNLEKGVYFLTVYNEKKQLTQVLKIE